MLQTSYIIKLKNLNYYFRHYELYKALLAIIGLEESVAIPLIKELLKRIHKIALDFSKKGSNCNKLTRPPIFISALLLTVCFTFQSFTTN